MKTILTAFQKIQFRKTGVLSKVLTMLLVLPLSLPAQAGEKTEKRFGFDAVTLLELNQEAQRLSQNTLGDFQENPSPEIRSLATQLSGYLLTSEVVYDQELLKKLSKIGEGLNPLMRILLMNSILLNVRDFLQMTKPGYFAPRSHEFDTWRALEIAFPIKFIEDVQNAQYERQLSQRYDMVSLLSRARSIALAIFILNGASECLNSWEAQVSALTHKYWAYASRLPSRVSLAAKEFNRGDRACSRSQKTYSEKELFTIAEKLFSAP